jgi:hypothetical protein
VQFRRRNELLDAVDAMIELADDRPHRERPMDSPMAP